MTGISKDTLKTQRWRQKRILFIQELKNKPCTDCKQVYPYYVMDFDHVRGEKLFGISSSIQNPVSMARLLAELDKCELVCSNCHRVRTHVRKYGIVA